MLILVPFLLSVCIGVAIVRIASRFQIDAKSPWGAIAFLCRSQMTGYQLGD